MGNSDHDFHCQSTMGNNDHNSDYQYTMGNSDHDSQHPPLMGNSWHYTWEARQGSWFQDSDAEGYLAHEKPPTPPGQP